MKKKVDLEWCKSCIKPDCITTDGDSGTGTGGTGTGGTGTGGTGTGGTGTGGAGTGGTGTGGTGGTGGTCGGTGGTTKDTTIVSVADVCADNGSDPTPPPVDHPILKGYFSASSMYNQSEPTGFPGSINKIPVDGPSAKPGMHNTYNKNTAEMEGKLELLDEIIYSFFAIKQCTDPKVVEESGGKMAKESTSYTHNETDAGKVYFFDPYSDLKVTDLDWIKANSDLLSEGFMDYIGNNPENIVNALGHGNFSAFAENPGDFKKIMGIGDYGSYLQSGWKAASDTNSYNFITSVYKIVDHYNIDGVNLDWEPLSLITDNNMQSNLISLSQNLKELDQIDLQVSLTVGTDKDQIEAFGANNWAYLSEILDEIIVGGWDMYDASTHPKLTGLQSMLYPIDEDCSEVQSSIHTAVQTLMENGVPAEKISVGYPSYSNGVAGVEEAKINSWFKIPDANANLNSSEGVASYKWVQNQVANTENAEEFTVAVKNESTGGLDKNTGAFLYLPDTEAFHSYDTTDSVKEKAQYVTENSLRGATTWLIENDVAADNSVSLLSRIDSAFSQV